MRIKTFSPSASPKTREYLEILFNDCCFIDRIQRNVWISLEIGRRIKFLDELTQAEASILIKKLKEIKESTR
jgi:hypothetical protein